MAKKIDAYIRLQVKAGQANPSPPVGPALGQHGVNIMDFCKAFNAKTQEMTGKLIPVEITVFADRSFTSETWQELYNYLLTIAVLSSTDQQLLTLIENTLGEQLIDNPSYTEIPLVSTGVSAPDVGDI